MTRNENTQRAETDWTAGDSMGSTSEIKDAVSENQINRLEEITGGEYEEEPELTPDELQRQFDALDASTEEEVDALEVNLAQESELGESRDSSGRVADDLAEEEIAKSTEVGPAARDRGAESVEPGTQDTSGTLRRHRPDYQQGGDSDAIVEGNIDEPLDEGLQ